jgi:hypothetical protein
VRGEFHPEWGYLAPAPSFVHRARVVLVATVVGATVGAGVVFSKVSHTATETSVSARTLVGPIGATSARGTTPAQVAQTNPPLRTEKQPGPKSELNGQGVDVATRESSASPTTRAPEGAAALAKASPVVGAPPALSAAAAKAHVASVTPIKKKVMTKPNVTRRYASRHESLGLVPGEYARRRSADEYRVSGARGGYYRESRQWGGYYGDGVGGSYQDW